MNSFKPKFLTLVLTLTLIVLETGCAGRKTRQPFPPEGANATPKNVLAPHDPTVNLPPASVVAPPSEGAKKEMPGVGLVVGGAGVASFATVGLLKRFQEEGIKIDFIVTTGWPTLFSLGFGFMRSVHDLEWFAMRLQEKDFYSVGIFDSNKDYASHEKLSALIEGAFRQRDLLETKIPVIISATNTELGDPETADRGDWKIPLLKTMSIPGIYRPYPDKSEEGGINSLQGLDVDEAVKRRAQVIIAVEMYDDYFDYLSKGAKRETSDLLFRKLYLAQLKRDVAKQMKQATITGKIILGKVPGDFGQKRIAIVAGYKEGARLAKQLRALANH